LASFAAWLALTAVAVIAINHRHSTGLYPGPSTN